MQLTQALTQQVALVGCNLREQLAQALQLVDQPAEFQPAISAAMQTSLAALEATGIVGWDNKQPSMDFWAAVSEYLELGSLQVHARTKPGGYPGDFRLLERICRWDKSTADPLGHAMDTYFQDQAAPHAVRNRCQEVAKRITTLAGSATTTRTITSIGAGPAWGIRQATSSLRENVPNVASRLGLQLLDVDPYALEFCEQELAKLIPDDSPSQITTSRVALNRTDRVDRALRRLQPSDLMFCLGFFDYLEEAAAIELLQCLWQHIAPGGQLLVFNFSNDNPSRSYMEWYGNWYLIYRSADCLTRMVEMAKLDNARFSVEKEPTGANLFLQIEKL